MLMDFFLKTTFAILAPNTHLPTCTCSKQKARIWQMRKLRHRSSLAQGGTHLVGFLTLRSSSESNQNKSHYLHTTVVDPGAYKNE